MTDIANPRFARCTSASPNAPTNAAPPSTGAACSTASPALARLADHSGLWPRIAGGCHPARDTGAAIARAGFDIQESDRLMFSASRFEPRIPPILGIARLTSR